MTKFEVNLDFKFAIKKKNSDTKISANIQYQGPY
jgi:hypothetical protein